MNRTFHRAQNVPDTKLWLKTESHFVWITILHVDDKNQTWLKKPQARKYKRLVYVTRHENVDHEKIMKDVKNTNRLRWN